MVENSCLRPVKFVCSNRKKYVIMMEEYTQSEVSTTMMDNFKEEIVVRKQGRILNALGYSLSWMFIVLFGLIGMMGLSGIMSLQFAWQNFVTLIVGGGVAFLLWRYKDNFRIEYEYSFTNGEMDFAMVLGNSRRKQLTSVRMREVEAGGWVDGPTFSRYEAMKEVKHLDYFLNSKQRLYYLFFIRDGKKQMLLMEPSQEMVDMMSKYSKALEA